MADEDRGSEQARADAKKLLAGLTDRHPAALTRVLASHPKFARRPADRAEAWVFTLADAQATVAVERGYDSWQALNLALNPRETWHSGFSDIEQRAFAEAQALGARFLGADHFLMALLKTRRSTPALEALTDLGLTYEAARGKVTRRTNKKAAGARSTHASAQLMGTANGIAIGLGITHIKDEHVLLALAFDQQSILQRFDVDPLDVVNHFAIHGVPLPIDPPPLEAPSGPFGPWVYVPRERLGEVTERLWASFPPGTARWGTNQSKWKKGYWWVHGEDSIPMEDLARDANFDQSLIEVLSFKEGLRVENADAKRRYRERP